MTRVEIKNITVVDCPREDNCSLKEEPEHLVKTPFNKIFCNSCGHSLKTIHGSETQSFVAKKPGICDLASAILYVFKPEKEL